MKRVDKKELILGAAGALFMMMGDLALSIVIPDNADEGLFLREAYLPAMPGHLSGLWTAFFFRMILSIIETNRRVKPFLH